MVGEGIPEDRRPFWSHCQRNENFSESLYDLPSPAPPLQNFAGRCGSCALLTDLMQRENGGVKQGSNVEEAEDKGWLWRRGGWGSGGGGGGGREGGAGGVSSIDRHCRGEKRVNEQKKNKRGGADKRA